MSPSVLPQKLVTATPLIQKTTLPCCSRGVSHPRGPLNQQKYWCKGWKVEPGRYKNVVSGPGFSCARKHVLLYAFHFHWKRFCFLESFCPEGLSWVCVASEAPECLGNHPGTAALVLQATQLGPQQDKQPGSTGGRGRAGFGVYPWGGLFSALLLHPRRREAQGTGDSLCNLRMPQCLVDRQHTSPMLCPEPCA